MATASTKSRLERLLYRARDLRAGALFQALRDETRGEVLDVGGWDFVETARRQQVPFARWTTLEPDPARTLDLDDPAVTCVHGDGCAMPFEDRTFDTVLCIQVLEHVLEPLRMMDEIARVLRPGGTAILMLPQTANLHLLPHHYQNFTRSWVVAAAARSGLDVVRVEAMGGAFSTFASRFVHFFVQSLRAPGTTYPDTRRSPLFYALWPAMAVYAAVSVPLCLLFAAGDMAEEANNHLAVLRKPAAPPPPGR